MLLLPASVANMQPRAYGQGGFLTALPYVRKDPVPHLPARWSLLLYPDNPITYNRQNGTWFVPLDLMLARKVDRTLEFGIGGAVKLGHPSDPSYRYVIDGRLIVYF